MSKFRIRRPSTALVVSMIALVMALGGTAYAKFTLPKNSVGTKQLKNGAVTTGKLKNGAVTVNKLNVTGVTVPNALHADSADTATVAGSANNANNANNATNAVNAANSQPMAFADVTDTGTLVTADTKNVGSVTKEGTDIYCLSGIPFTVRGGQATINYNDSGLEYAQLGIGTDGVTCPANTQAFVFTLTSTGGASAGFFVHLYG